MSTLYKRANGQQKRMLRIISGAVLNTAHAHPGQLPDLKFARGVAKRAVGTLSAQWADTLAAKSQDVLPSGNRWDTLSPQRSRVTSLLLRDAGRSHFNPTAPFSKLCAKMSRMIGPLIAKGETEKVEALRAAIIALAPLVRKEKGKS